MNLTDIGIVFGICASVATGTGAAGKYYLDHEYVTIGSVEQALNKAEVRDIKRMIRRLEYKKEKGTITDQERWELQGLYQELEELQ